MIFKFFDWLSVNISDCRMNILILKVFSLKEIFIAFINPKWISTLLILINDTQNISQTIWLSFCVFIIIIRSYFGGVIFWKFNIFNYAIIKSLISLFIWESEPSTIKLTFYGFIIFFLFESLNRKKNKSTWLRYLI